MKKLTKKEMKHVVGGGGEFDQPPFMGMRYTCYAYSNDSVLLSGCFIAAPILSCAYCEGGQAIDCYGPEEFPANLCP